MNPQSAAGAFTRDQLWRGALHAWLGFVTLLTIAAFVWAALASMRPFTPPSVGAAVYAAGWVAAGGGVVSIFVTVLGLPVAALVGYALRGVRRRWVHLSAFAAFGIAIGAAVVSIFTAMSRPAMLDPVMVGVVIAVCAGATVYGRWQADRTPNRRDPPIEEEDRPLRG